MKKQMLSLAVTLAVLLGLSCGMLSLGSDSDISETPEIGIIVAGKEQKYAQPPIIVDGSTFLPLRALAATLGIPNDDAHIAWNDADKSVTLKSADGAKTIFLQIGSKVGRVNDVEKTLNAAPALYKNSTYIPLRFVADALDMTVLWDAKTRDVYIRSSAEYELVNMVFCKMHMKELGPGSLYKYKETKRLIDTSVESNEVVDDYRENATYLLNVGDKSFKADGTFSNKDGKYSFSLTPHEKLIFYSVRPGGSMRMDEKESKARISDVFKNAWVDMDTGKQLLGSRPDPNPVNDGSMDIIEVSCMRATMSESDNAYSLHICYDPLSVGDVFTRYEKTYIVDKDTFIILHELIDSEALIKDNDGVSVKRACTGDLDFTVETVK